MNDHDYMSVALDLAREGLGKTVPNPSVGCVIVKDDEIIAKARTANSGRPHAETIAIEQAGENTKSATLYVTLEPCNTCGHTGPCVSAIIKAGIQRVVIACSDPFQKDAGSIDALKQAGIDVVENFAKEEAEEINKGFFTTITKNRPWVTVKIATSLDGKIATASGESKWITSEASRHYVHQIRATYDGILTGTGTLMADNPTLTVRLEGYDGPQPKRFVLNNNQKLPEQANILNDIKQSPVYFVTSQQPQSELKDKGLQFINAPYEEGFDLNTALEKIKDKDITRLLIEAGPKTITSFLKTGLVDEILWFKAPVLIGNDGIPAFGDLDIQELSKTYKLSLIKSQTIDKDIYERWRVNGGR